MVGIYPQNLADRLKDDEGKPYCPSNGSEGDFFMSQYCFQCAKWRDDPDAKTQCPIAIKTFFIDKNDPKYPKEWCYKDGQPTCTAFKNRDAHNSERRLSRTKPKVDKRTEDMFGQVLRSE